MSKFVLTDRDGKEITDWRAWTRPKKDYQWRAWEEAQWSLPARGSSHRRRPVHGRSPISWPVILEPRDSR